LGGRDKFDIYTSFITSPKKQINILLLLSIFIIILLGEKNIGEYEIRKKEFSRKEKVKK